MTLAELASETDSWPSQLSEIERGLRLPTLGLAARLSRFTGGEVPIDSFVQLEAAE